MFVPSRRRGGACGQPRGECGSGQGQELHRPCQCTSRGQSWCSARRRPARVASWAGVVDPPQPRRDGSTRERRQQRERATVAWRRREARRSSAPVALTAGRSTTPNGGSTMAVGKRATSVRDAGGELGVWRATPVGGPAVAGSQRTCPTISSGVTARQHPEDAYTAAAGAASLAARCSTPGRAGGGSGSGRWCTSSSGAASRAGVSDRAARGRGRAAASAGPHRGSTTTAGAIAHAAELAGAAREKRRGRRGRPPRRPTRPGAAAHRSSGQQRHQRR